MGDDSDRSTPLELLTGVQEGNEAESNIVSLLEEPAVPEDPHSRLAISGAIRDEWSGKLESTKLAAAKPLLRSDIAEGDKVLAWRSWWQTATWAWF